MTTFGCCGAALLLSSLTAVIVLPAVSSEPVHCAWGPWSSWSACDACSKTQTQVRSVSVYPQFGGQPCSGDSLRTQSCETTQDCPLVEGCGERFRCQSGECISQVLVCNGDVDCEDNSDEQRCENRGQICNLQKPPPQIELTGLGYDAVRGEFRGSVINTKSFGGQCRRMFSGDHKDIYRLPHSVLRYNFQVTAKNDFSSEFYSSSWHYVKNIDNRENTHGTTTGHNYFTSKEELKKIQTRQLVVISSDVEVAQFQNQPPENLPLSEDFWKVLSTLPVVYDYAAYRRVLERFGTHFLSEGTLGGQFRTLLHFSQDFTEKSQFEKHDFRECVKKTHTVLFFFSWTTVKCREFYNFLKREEDNYKRDQRKNIIEATAIGGHTAYISALTALDPSKAAENWRSFSQWAGSVKDLPTITSQKIRPLYELVKEVSCAGVKKLHLRKALQSYLSERSACHCRPCRNNGLSVLREGVCECVCKAGTHGSACENGAPVEEQPGVIDGGWSCWSAWSICSAGRQSRSRSCSHPPPQNGKNCVGNSEETINCEEEEELQYLRTMEPHCFDQTLEPIKSCRNPPPLRNGFVQDPKDVYLVGNKVEYSCIDGYQLIGEPLAECVEEQTWRRSQQECRRSACEPPLLPADVSGSPWKLSYRIGETIELSCPAGRERDGPSEIHCNAGLAWSPQSESTKCRTAATKALSLTECQPWEKLAKDNCVCKVPYECEPSLEVCATSLERRRTSRLSVCKVRAMQCLGHQFILADHSACQWPEPSTAVCPQCSLWTLCDDQSQVCRCRTLEECAPPTRWIQVCALLSGESTPSTVSECEVGVRQCGGETPDILSLQPCDA
ncbi:complement component C7 isoform X1 [Colossoma macropomum]|uniref:complement component C7 isoform X1 n=1 Tax=Colossoma macropomum TaxID=42526 RepID=UPI001863A04E|nr:complement component C7 isoform X1 [Colossoma macropomum]